MTDASTVAPDTAGPGADSPEEKAPTMSDARYKATQRLINAYRDDFETFYADEAEKLGLKTPRMKKDERRKKLQEELDKLNKELGEDDEGGDPDRTTDLAGDPVE